MTIKELLEKSEKVNFTFVWVKDKEETYGYSQYRYYHLPADLEKLLARYGDCENFNYGIEMGRVKLNIEIKD